MRQECGNRDLALAELAGRQHGVVAAYQLVPLGFDYSAIRRRVIAGRLHRLHQGVYAVGHPAVTRHGELMAAVLACGPNAFLSHRSAGELWEFLPRAGSTIEVIGERNRRGRQGIAFRRVGELHRDERTRRDGIPVTSAPRTLLDLAAVLSPKQIAGACDQADRRGWLNRRAMGELCERHRGRMGVGALRAVIDATDPAARRTRSDWETDFLRFCGSRRLPKPLVNVKIEGYEVDFYWPGAKLIVELDSYEFHRTRAAFERDRRRDAHLKSLGYDVIRITYYWLADEPDQVAAMLKRRLELAADA